MIEAGEALIDSAGGGLAGAGLSTGGAVSGVAGAAIVTLPTENPASRKVMVALPSGCPVKLGITNACGEVCSTSKLILGAEMSVALAGGFCPITNPAIALEIETLAVEPSSSPRWAMLISAALSLSPTACGMATRCPPRLKARRTSHPRRTVVPALGTCERTLPSGTVGL